MPSFSQRKGIESIKSAIQLDSMDDDLKNGLWNALTLTYWCRIDKDLPYLRQNTDMFNLFNLLWFEYFKKPVDTLDDYWPTTYNVIRKYFFTCKWDEIYSFVEFIANFYPNKSTNQEFIEFSNKLLEKELSAYRFVGGIITQITSENEITEIENALNSTSKPVVIHLNTALKYLSDRRLPDYRNSIKESISAVEAICKQITALPKADLNGALKAIDKNESVILHKDLKSAFHYLYDYTSDEHGVRHALMDAPNLDFEDAKFMLVSCSAFTNYLIMKSQKAGIKLST